MTGSAVRPRSALEEMSKDGAFVRRDAVWRNWIEDGGRFSPEAGRYHLYVSLACPWANRCLAVRNLKGLQDAIGVSVVHPTWQRTRPDDPKDDHCGWAFASPGDKPFSSPSGYGSFPPDECIPDTVNGARFVRDLYEMAGDTGGKYTVPILWDKKESTIVSNESADIVQMFNSAFGSIARNSALDLAPAELEAAAAEIDPWVYAQINNGVYRCGFATSQEAYDKAFDELFEALDRVEAILAERRYLLGDQLSLSDIRLFMTLIRFDEIYVVYFKTNRQRIRDYPNLSNYVRELYAIPSIRSCTSVENQKRHYFTSHPKLNSYAIVPKGGDAWWAEPGHDRARFGGDGYDA